MSQMWSVLAPEFLKDVTISIEQKLLDLLPIKNGNEDHIVEAMRYALMAGGKRLRPFLVMTCSEIFTVDKISAIRVACAVECVHTYSLIHDDLPSMDDDDLRRGKPTVHKKFDEATAILAGDALLTFAFELLSDEETHSDANVRCELISGLARSIGAMGMVGGQMLDLKAENKNLNQEAIIRMQQLKTGALIVFSCEAAAILAKVSDDRRCALIEYAKNIGLAFQIVDDLLDVEGKSEDIGKTAGKDIDAGKATLVSLWGVEKAKKEANTLIDQAISRLECFKKNGDALRSMAEFVLRRAH
jgi:farnesyl diphosphate synthase